MYKKFNIAFFLFLISSFNFIFADVYVDRYGRNFTYNKSIPYRYVARVTTHWDFTNVYLDDGSVFRINDTAYGKEACTWYVNDPIIIYPNSNVFRNEDYQVYNERVNKSIFGNISCSPAANNLTYLQIVEISYTDNVVTLINGASENFHFQVSPDHIHKVSKWMVEDCLILGWNIDLWTGSDINYPYILINTNANEYVNSEYIQY